MIPHVQVGLLEPRKDDDWLMVLDEGERARWARLAQVSDRRAYLTAHGLLRHLLSKLDQKTPPSEWRFAVGLHGKPFLPGSKWSFSLSHCRELVAVAVCEGCALGVDVEHVDPRHATDMIAHRVYGPAELADISAQPDRVARFFERWTLKEALVKAMGTGIGEDLPSIELRMEPGRAFITRGDSRSWQLHWWTPRPTVKMALCVAGAEQRTVSVVDWSNSHDLFSCNSEFKVPEQETK